MKVFGFFRTTVFFAIAALFLGTLLFYFSTFFTWNASPRFLMKLDSILKETSMWPLTISVVAALIVSLFKGKLVSWSTKSSPLWIQGFTALVSIVMFVIFVGTGLTQRTAIIRIQGTATEAFVDGKWDSLPPIAFERIVRGNTRWRLVWVLTGVFICLGMAGGSCEAIGSTKWWNAAFSRSPKPSDVSSDDS